MMKNPQLNGYLFNMLKVVHYTDANETDYRLLDSLVI